MLSTRNIGDFRAVILIDSHALNSTSFHLGFGFRLNQFRLNSGESSRNRADCRHTAGLGVGVEALGFRVEDLGFRVQGSGFRF